MPAMGNYKNPLAEKILLDISNVFSKDEELCEFDIIPVETNNSNKSPVLHSNHSLGLEGWCMKSLYSHCYSVLMDQFISKGAQGTAKSKINITNWEEADRLLVGALLINPDVSVFWNKRREMYVRGFIKFYDEMKFTRCVLSRKSKCNEVFAYRKWLLEQHWEEPEDPDPDDLLNHIMSTLVPELALTQTCAEKSPNNYHAWTHRTWLMQHFMQRAPGPLTSYWALGELTFSENWISRNISDHSGLHYRQFSIDCALQFNNSYDFLATDNEVYKDSIKRIMCNIGDYELTEDKSEKDVITLILGTILHNTVHHDINDANMYKIVYQNLAILLYDLDLNKDLSEIYTSHEALWSHRRFTIKRLLNVISRYFGNGDFVTSVALNLNSYSDRSNNIVSCVEDVTNASNGGLTLREAKIFRLEHYSVCNSHLYRALALNEKRYIEQRTANGDVFASKYLKWLRHVLGFFNVD